MVVVAVVGEVEEPVVAVEGEVLGEVVEELEVEEVEEVKEVDEVAVVLVERLLVAMVKFPVVILDAI